MIAIHLIKIICLNYCVGLALFPTLIMPEVNFYETKSGKYPVVDFLNSLSGKQAQKVSWVLELFEETNIVPKQYFKKLKSTNVIFGK